MTSAMLAVARVLLEPLVRELAEYLTGKARRPVWVSALPAVLSSEIAFARKKWGPSA